LNPSSKLYLKLEYLNPGFSKKDRIALQVIEDAERSGILKPNQTVVEMTSGNTGTGLAIVCKQKGYNFVAVMSSGNSFERAVMMRSFGAEVVLVPQSPGSKIGEVSRDDIDLVERKTEEIVKERNGFRVDQFHNPSNFKSHFKTGDEIWNQLGGQIDLFADFIGTSGTFVGVSKRLKEKSNNSIQCFIIEPKKTSILSTGKIQSQSHKIQGGGYSMTIDELFLSKNKNLIDGFLEVSDEEAIECCRSLAQYESVFSGFSTGANVCGALKLLKKEENKGKSCVVLACDTGLKYISAGLWDSKL